MVGPHRRHLCRKGTKLHVAGGYGLQLRKNGCSLVLVTIDEMIRRLGFPIAKRQSYGYSNARRWYFQGLMKEISGDGLPEKILGGGIFDERVVEYATFCQYLEGMGQVKTMLDIGMTTNNELVSGQIERHVNTQLFINPSADELILANVQSKVLQIDFRERISVPDSEKVDFVACISTIEHVGYSNLQYGAKAKPEYRRPHIRPLLDLAEFIEGNLSQGSSHFFVTFPIGKRRLNLHPVTLRWASQTFDKKATLEFVRALEKFGFEVNLNWWSIQGNDFVKNNHDAWMLSYGKNAVAASGVAIIAGARVKDESTNIREFEE